MTGATVITVGNELMVGRIVDSNAAWISAKLAGAGFPVAGRETVPDEVQAIAAAVRRAQSRTPVVVVTGGIGPTPDDVTREGVAAGLDLPLEPHAGARSLIAAFFEHHGREMPEREDMQAFLPRGARPIENRRGTAPGILVDREDLLLAVLPGVPAEMQHMFESGVLPLLEQRPDRQPVPSTRAVTIVGMPESLVAEKLGDLLARDRNPVIGSYPQTAQVVLEISATASTDAAANAMLDDDIEEIRRRLGDTHVAGTGRLLLHHLVGGQLIAQGVTLALAESLTGGLLSERLVSVPGISAVFQAGLVTYSNESKMRVLGVREETLLKHGAVSAECAREMALGALEAGQADLAVSTTGIAGPTGGTPEKPVGTVYLGLAAGGAAEAHHRLMVGDRAQIRERTVHWALDAIRRHLADYPART